MNLCKNLTNLFRKSVTSNDSKYGDLVKAQQELSRKIHTNSTNFKGGGKSIYSDRTLQYIIDILLELFKGHDPLANKNKINNIQNKAKKILRTIKNKNSNLYKSMDTIATLKDWTT